jgi:hypothetical protein
MTTFELEVKEQRQFEKDYQDWCKKYDPNYVIERDIENPDLEVLNNQKD